MVLINFSDNKKEAIPAFGRLHHTIKHYFQQRYERSDIWGCNNFIRNFPWWSDEHSQVKVTLSLFFKPLCPHFWHWRCCANQWTGFYMITASVMKELDIITKSSILEEAFVSLLRHCKFMWKHSFGHTFFAVERKYFRRCSSK